MCPRSAFRSGGTCERTLVPVFRSRGNIRTYPRSGFCSGGTSAKTTLLETTLLGSSDYVPFLLPINASHDVAEGAL